MWTVFLKSLLNLLQYCFCFMFWVFGCEACGILAPQPGNEPTPPALEGEVLTTGSPGKSQWVSFKWQWTVEREEEYLICIKPCWVATPRPASPVLSQPRDQRKSLESATETSMISWIRGIFLVWTKVLEWHPTMCSRGGQDLVAVFTPRWDGEGGYQLQEELTLRWCLLVARETSRGVHPSPPLW